ncbi:MAG: hypothetical protein JST79_05660 [Acidobacteria bacterium]|nr:hypothetical protein [Acidobacteriota bacterium]
MTVILRPLSTSELLDRTFFLYRKHFLLFTGIIAVPQLFVLALQLLNAVLGLRVFPMATVVTSILLTLISVLLLFISHAAVVAAVSQVHLERAATIGGSFAAIKGRIVPILGIMFLIGLAIGVAFLFLIIPGILLGLAWSLAIPVTVLEGTGLSDTTTRSSFLTKGDRGRIFVIYFLFVVLTYLVIIMVTFALVLPIGLLGLHDPQTMLTWQNVLSSIANFLSTSLVGALLTIALSLIYFDERVRKEGFDLQLMMATVDSPSPATPLPPLQAG